MCCDVAKSKKREVEEPFLATYASIQSSNLF